jgi:ribonuclease III
MRDRPLNRLDELQQRLGYRFTRTELLERALTHRSIGSQNNERLEFLGDAVLNLAISQLLFEHLITSNEGDLSRLRAHLVREDSLHQAATRVGLPAVVRMSDSERRGGGAQRAALLADALEAVLGAAFVEGQFDAAQTIVEKLFGEAIRHPDLLTCSKDAKTELQELLQAQRLPVPNYTIVATEGKAHEQIFEVQCQIPKLNLTCTGSGRSRRVAEQAAAKNMLLLMQPSVQ